jgi:AcrR family transcriptional regulator
MGRRAHSDEHRASTRAGIREAALSLYREGGIDAVTMRAVASRAGLSSAALYDYFPKRRDLLQSLWYEPVASAVEALRRLAAATPDPIDRLRGCCRPTSISRSPIRRFTTAPSCGCVRAQCLSLRCDRLMSWTCIACCGTR